MNENIQSLCGNKPCPLIGSTSQSEKISNFIAESDPNLNDQKLTFVISIARFAIYIGSALGVIAFLISVLLVIIALFRGNKGLKPAFIIMGASVALIAILIFSLTLITVISSFNYL